MIDDRKKIVVTGSSGQLGSELKELSLDYPDLQFIFFEKKELPIADREALQNVFLQQPDYFINFAAYTAVDRAEEEKEIAFEINGTAAGAIAELCAQHHCRLIHISTDYVFNATNREPLNETTSVD